MSQKTPKLDHSQLMRLFLGKEYQAILEVFIHAFQELSTFSYPAITEPLRKKLNRFIELFFFFFCSEDIVLDSRAAERFIPLNATISNIIALTDFENTDLHLSLLHDRTNHNRKSHLGKILTLFSARNSIDLDRSVFFDIDARLASLWWMHFFDLYASALAKDLGYAQLNHHLLSLDPRLEFQGNINRTFFAVSYINETNDRPVKEAINSWVKKMVPNNYQRSSHPPKKGKIAILSGCWRNTHAVYKNQLYALGSLRDDFEMTFFPLRPNQDTSLFHEVNECFLQPPLDLSQLSDNTFELAYFPDVGMTYQSIVLSNLRFAPIQVTSFGHSVSSFGGELDYYIVGEDVENVSLYEENYSERLVVLPGLGIIHKPFDETLQRETEDDNKEIIIGCGWSSQKCNFPALLQLREIAEKATTPVRFRFLVGSGVERDNGLLPFTQDLKNILGETRVEIFTHLPYLEYLEKLSETSLFLDSYHFGGCNTIIDALLLNKPIVSRMGSKWYNRIGGAELRAVGLPELVAENEEEYMKITLKLINNKSYREKLRKKIKKIELQSTVLFDKNEAPHFKHAIDYLIENHEKLKKAGSKEPIFIGN